jgi:endogenous inhibitor of DNA gyrase (YacG/DUF329 family)
MRVSNTIGKCFTCKTPIEQPRRGRTRLYCSDACKQKYYRFMRRYAQGRSRRHRKLPERTVYQRPFSADSSPTVTHRLNQFTAAYECQMCGQQFIRHTIRSKRVSAYCSTRCRDQARARWSGLIDASYRADSQGRPDWNVVERMGEGYLSPICPHCKLPFAPRRGRGRRRTYCSDVCRKAAYELRYRRAKRRPRQHHYADCPNCGSRFDREHGNSRFRTYCSDSCQSTFISRRRRNRGRAAVTSDFRVIRKTP